MKKWLLLGIFTLITSKAWCCEQFLSPTPDPSPFGNNTFMYDLLTSLAQQTKELETLNSLEKIDDFEKFKFSCATQPQEIRLLQDSHGNRAHHILLNAAITLYAQGICGSEVQRTVDQWFPFAVFCELINCGLDPEENYEWYNPRTKKSEKKESFISLLEKHKDKPGILRIAAKIKALKLGKQ